MTAFAYKRPFVEPKGCIGEGQQPANCSHSRCSKKSDRSVRSSLSCGHSLATPTSDIDVLLGFVSVPSCQLVECVRHGASGDRYQVPIPRLARELVGDWGFFALSIDGPAHGRRRQGDGERRRRTILKADHGLELPSKT